ncbi:hypothetical protein FPV67DRAFT_350382 [Lyophyllum atratum]|nr:hypothetical protein FPV67DRAFT_350382 [Lyophyllum atratum]
MHIHIDISNSVHPSGCQQRYSEGIYPSLTRGSRGDPYSESLKPNSDTINSAQHRSCYTVVISILSFLSVRFPLAFRKKKKARIPMPALLTIRFEADQPLLIVSCASTFIATTIFTLSMLDLGALSLHFSPIISGVTLIFHIGYFVLRSHYHRSKPSSRFPPAVALRGMLIAYILWVAWLIPLVLTIYQAASGRPLVRRLMKTFVLGNLRAFAIPQAILIGVELGLFGLVVVLATVTRRQSVRSDMSA